MQYEHLVEYIKQTEKMVLPEEVSKINQASLFLRKLPLGIQKYLADQGSKKNPYMGFIVEPYSFFLSFEITNTELASTLLPSGYELIKTSIFEGEEPRYCAILGAFNVHTSVFWGTRLELYLIAQNKKTGMMSWIIANYETNTISYDPGQGFTGPSTSHCVVTTSYQGEIIVDVLGRESGKRLALTADITRGVKTPLTQRLWVEGNLSVDYGGDHDAGNTQPFGLVFDPSEMKTALKLPQQALRLAANSFGSGFLADQPFEIACFPFAQHFVTTSMPEDLGLRNAEELEAAVVRFSSGIKK